MSEYQRVLAVLMAGAPVSISVKEFNHAQIESLVNTAATRNVRMTMRDCMQLPPMKLTMLAAAAKGHVTFSF